MQVVDLASTYGTQSIVSIEGQTLRDICLACYGRDDTDYRMIITELNDRVDWDYLPVTNIRYLSQEVVQQHWIR